MRDVCYEKVIDIVDKEQVFMEHILLPGDAARIRYLYYRMTPTEILDPKKIAVSSSARNK